MDRTIFNARRLHVAFATRTNRRLEKWQLTVHRVEVFCCHRAILGRHGVVYQSDLRARLGISRSTMSIMLQRMEKHGLIARRPSDADRRNVVVTITPEGYAAFAAVEHLIGECQSVVDLNLRIVSPYEPIAQKRARFLLYLDTLRAHFGDYSNIVYPAAPWSWDTPTRECA